MFDQKKYIETFSQVHASEKTLTEVLNMTKQKKTHYVGRLTRALAVAAVMTAMLATTVFAYVGFTQYENPTEMLKIFFGSDEYRVDEGGIRTETIGGKPYDVIEPTVEHVPVDTKVAEEYVAPFISDVGKSITYDGDTLTVEAHHYDSATNCGIIYYTVENPDGVTGYELQDNGEVWWPGGEKVQMSNVSEKNYIVEEETTATKLTVASYYCGANEADVIEVYFYDDTVNSLKLRLDDGGGMAFKAYEESSIVVSPIAIRLRLTDFDSLGKILEDGSYLPPVDDVRLDYLAVRFTDGSVYVVRQDEENAVIHNYHYALIKDYDKEEPCASYVFNRLIDVEAVDAVIINDQEYAVK